MRAEDLINDLQKIQKEIENDPKKIDEFCLILTDLYWKRMKTKSKKKMLKLERAIQKGTDILVTLQWLAIEKEIYMNVDNSKDLIKLEVKMPRNVIGDICGLIAKSFKLSVALKDDIKRFRILGILGDLTRILIGIRFILYRGEKVDVDTIKNELADLKKEFEQIVKCDVSP
jgi:hypothetical protein